ncbi:hypothetical protein MSAN_00606300 [Mycena sanguinolenta]|uniref:Uncharacterized protein n=1 Tax=Mycena sanguinolenta TaxID=230812 RepID=A0A8H6ZB17_9AGAR|nr:hypothetical protein MSAN_00606300 [Mycena sanguinolenta]
MQPKISQPALAGISRLSSKSWNKARWIILPEVLRAKRDRLSAEFHARAAARRGVIRDALEAIMSHRQPATWAYNASVSGILEFPEFQDLVAAPEDEKEVLASDDARLVIALAELPAKLESRSAARRTFLSAKVFGPTSASEDVLDPATSASSRGEACPNANRQPCCFVGWKDVGASGGPRTHSNVYIPGSCHFSPFTFSQRASAAAYALVELAGLDPRNAIVDQMDALDLRFVCNDCPIQEREQEVMAWRVCLQHTLKHVLKESGQARHISSWTLLSPIAAKDVRRREGTILPTWMPSGFAFYAPRTFTNVASGQRWSHMYRPSMISRD